MAAVGELETQESLWSGFQSELGSKGERKLMSQLEDRQKELILPYQALHSIHAFNRLGGAHPH